MSNGLAIAAVTRTLFALLAHAATNVSMRPLDKARDGAASDEQLNLFLYNTPVSAAFRNSDPAGLRPGESGSPPLPLALHYLLTAFGPDEAAAHKVLGLAMRILHDHTLLSPQEIRDANSGEDTGEVDNQVERVRITPLPLSNHDLFELWSGFATSYRVSAAYEVSVVLIDSTRPSRTPLPVLQRGPAAVTGGDAALTAVLPPDGATIATLGATVRVLGSNLGAITGIEFNNPHFAAPKALVPAVISDTECHVTLPAAAVAATTWPAGFYQLRAVTQRPALPRAVSNSVPMGLGPAITVSSPTTPVAAGDLTVTVDCQPTVLAGQSVRMLLSSAESAHDTVTSPGTHSTISSTFPAVKPGTYTIRLRIDQADSDPVRYTGSPAVPQFDPAVQLVVT